MNASESKAVVQTTLEPPPVDQLARALARVPGFLAADAPNVARDAFGILARRLDAATAAALRDALAAEGIPTEVVPEARLPALPPGRTVRQLECHSDALMIFDPLNRRFPVAWKHLTLVAAGEVRGQEFVAVRRPERDPFAATGRFKAGDLEGFTTGIRWERSTREQTVLQPVLELVLGGAAQRLIVEVTPSLFGPLGEARRPDLWENFTRLVRLLLQHAPHARPNRGAWCLRREPPARFSYPSRNAFHEELIWMLWQSAR